MDDIIYPSREPDIYSKYDRERVKQREGVWGCFTFNSEEDNNWVFRKLIDENEFTIYENCEGDYLFDKIVVSSVLVKQYGESIVDTDKRINNLIEFYSNIGGKLFWYNDWSSPTASASGFVVLEDYSKKVLRSKCIWVS
jgi:hypothetical protein